ncbi:MAG: amidohydrolase family protein [Xanthomonadales bacterium]|nr:amidohydrolase family protein [Xanthomonadales bacterium]
MRRIVFILLIAAFQSAHALPPEPGKPQSGPIALVGGTIHTGTGETIENGVVAFDAGRITVVGPASGFDAEGHEVVDVSGLRVYPGFVLPDNQIGLEEVGALRHTIDKQERGELNPSVRSLIAYNTDSELIPTTRFNGVLVAQVSPIGGLVSGLSSVMEMDGWNWEDAALKADDALHVNWPSKKRGRFDWTTFSFNFAPNPDYERQMAEIQSLFLDAKAYGDDPNPAGTNLKLAALQGLFDGSLRLFLDAESSGDLLAGLEFLREIGVQNIVVSGDEILLDIVDYLAAHDIPVIVEGTHNTPPRAHDDIDLPFRLPALLVDAGLTVGLSYPSIMNARNLPFAAGTAAAYGLGWEGALEMITLSNARVLGIDDRVGSLEVGKDATLFVSRGDALDMRGNQLEHAFIRGKSVRLNGMQQELYQRYKSKYGEQTGAGN